MPKVIIKDELQIKIKGTTYSLLQAPPSNSPLVVAQRAKLIGLKMLMQNLCDIGMCIRVAQYGMLAAGPKFTEPQNGVQDLVYDVRVLCNKSAITVSNFSLACTSIQRNLLTACEFLLKDIKDLAIMYLEQVSKYVGQIFVATEELNKDFEEEAMKVHGLAKEIKLLHDKQKSHANDLKQKLERLTMAEQCCHEFEKKEDEANQKLRDLENICTKLANGLTHMVLGTRLFGKQEMYHWNKIKSDASKNRTEWENIYEDRLHQIKDCADSTETCNHERQMAESAFKALEKATCGLYTLENCMTQAALFWKRMQKHCKAMEESEMKRTFEKVMDNSYNDDQRRKLRNWTVVKFVTLCAGWVALDSVMGDYRLAMENTQKDINEHIRSNPSHEDADKNVERFTLELQKKSGVVHEFNEGRDSK